MLAQEGEGVPIMSSLSYLLRVMSPKLLTHTPPRILLRLVRQGTWKPATY